ncbi:hypothetical protein [Streptomyces sp. NPDC048282]|uniref:hypothetical protein n=1 Tax=unclassified Streptomyces TaxID=2593676 RepID=UPI0037107DBE
MDAAPACPGARISYMTDRPTRGWIVVASSAVAEDEVLGEWIGQRHALAASLPSEQDPLPRRVVTDRTVGRSGHRLSRASGCRASAVRRSSSCAAPGGGAARRAARAHGTRLVVTHADDRARSILDQVGLARALPVRRGAS